MWRVPQRAKMYGLVQGAGCIYGRFCFAYASVLWRKKRPLCISETVLKSGFPATTHIWTQPILLTHIWISPNEVIYAFKRILHNKRLFSTVMSDLSTEMVGKRPFPPLTNRQSFVPDNKKASPRRNWLHHLKLVDAGRLYFAGGDQWIPIGFIKRSLNFQHITTGCGIHFQQRRNLFIPIQNRGMVSIP